MCFLCSWELAPPPVPLVFFYIAGQRRINVLRTAGASQHFLWTGTAEFLLTMGWNPAVVWFRMAVVWICIQTSKLSQAWQGWVEPCTQGEHAPASHGPFWATPSFHSDWLPISLLGFWCAMILQGDASPAQLWYPMPRWKPGYRHQCCNTWDLKSATRQSSM